jgi:hypothetical protein
MVASKHLGYHSCENRHPKGKKTEISGFLLEFTPYLIRGRNEKPG